MNAHVRDALVDGYQTLIPALKLPDPEDCHVLAAAIQCRADLSLTFNFNDFPELVLATHGISARRPPSRSVSGQPVDSGPRSRLHRESSSTERA
jgi:hypothetical protein